MEGEGGGGGWIGGMGGRWWWTGEKERVTHVSPCVTLSRYYLPEVREKLQKYRVQKFPNSTLR